MATDKNIVLEDARIRFRNFSGKEDKYNPPGRRNFCVLIDQKMAKDLIKDGWNVKQLRPREEGDDPQPYLQVTVSYNNFPPKVVLVTSNGQTVLDEDDLDMLDWAEIEKADLIIRPYNWDVNGKQGVKAYAKTLYVTIVEDELEKKYSDINGSGSTATFADINDDDVPF